MLKLTKNEMKKYTVDVDGHEITNKFITYSEAKRLLDAYKEIGADNIVITEGRDVTRQKQ